MSRMPRVMPAAAAEIKRLRRQGLLCREIAQKLGVSVNTASRYGRAPERERRPMPRLSPGQGRPPMTVGEPFIRPPSLAQLMARR